MVRSNCTRFKFMNSQSDTLADSNSVSIGIVNSEVPNKRICDSVVEIFHLVRNIETVENLTSSSVV